MMHFRFGMTLVFLVGAAWPAMAQSNCEAPIAPPAAPNGRTATQIKINDAISRAKSFIAKSDLYQTCLLDYVKAQKDLAAQNKTSFDTSIEADAMNKISENQTEKAKVGGDINAAITAFKTSRPN
jgi:hypothetical protein